jgi:HD superfamily phosphohydrolase YqeK
VAQQTVTSASLPFTITFAPPRRIAVSSGVSYYSNSIANTDTFEEIDASIAALLHDAAIIQEKIRVLRTRRNALTPICRLPAEVLVHVFNFSQEK